MKKKSRQKWLSLLMILTLLLPTLTLKVSADETTTNPDANEMTRSMITFFQKDRTSLQVERVAEDELRVYGVFLSNFFMPWSTELDDMIDDSTDTSIPKQISTKFFGSPANSKEVVEINKKLYTAINDVMKTSKKKFGMYATKDATKVMTGQQFYYKMAGKDTKSEIYSEDGRVLLDLSDKATQASLQVIFGISPEFMLSGGTKDKDYKNPKGLRALTGLYMDGLGNVWGSYENAPINEYVLFIPSALNPVVFSKDPKKGKFPVSNVFAMGGALKPTENFLDAAKLQTPYYNIAFPQSKYNKDNIVSIFGVQSPTGYIGNSKDIIRKGVNENPIKKVKDFLNQDASSSISSKDANVVVSIDAAKVKDMGVDTHFKNGNSLSDKEKTHLISYLLKTNVFELKELADDMYYFKVPRAGDNNTASDPNAGSFDTPTDLIRKQKLFAKEIEAGVEYEFYNGSVYPSPFNSFLREYLSLVDQTKSTTTLLEKYVPKTKGLKSTDQALLDFKYYLEKGTWGTKDEDRIKKAMNLFKGSDPLVYNLIPATNGFAKIVKDVTLWEWIHYTAEPTSFALTQEDRDITVMSAAALNSGWYKLSTTSYDVKTYYPFEATDGGGSIKPKDGELTDRDTRSMSTLFHLAHTYRIFSMNATFTNQLTGTEAKGKKYSTPWGKDTLQNGTAIMNDVNNFPGIYWGYMVELLQIKPKHDNSGWEDPVEYKNNHLPVMEISTLGGGLDLNEAFGESGVVASEDKTLEEMQKDIVKKVYGLLSDGPNDYRDKLIKSAQDSWILSTHRSLTGSWIGDVVSVSAGGNGSYASVVGYINTPNLTDLPLTEWVIKDYMYIYMVLMLIVIITLVLLVITNMRSLREGILILIVMSFVLVLPQFALANVINFSNSAGDKIYSGRFNYWAITQHQQTLANSLNSRISGDEMDFIINESMQSAKNVYSSDVGVRVKWMSPKKDDAFESMFNKNTASQSLMSNLTIFRWLFNSYLNQEEYVHDDPLATYLYRPYNAIAKEASQSYNSLKEKVVKRDNVGPIVASASKDTLLIPDYRFKTLYGETPKVNFTAERKALVTEAGPFVTSTNTPKMESYRFWALNHPGVTESIFRSDFTTDAGTNSDITNPFYNAYSLTTESPFYYFYNVFKHRYADGDNFKSSLLDKDMFKVVSSNPEINNKTRDFLDLEGLFTYVIPYLHQGNQYVYGWTSIYGRNIDGYDFSSGEAPTLTGVIGAKNIREQKAIIEKYASEEAKKENLKRVWKLYTPWVDQMYTIKGALNGKAFVGDRKVTIEDAMNPGAYDKIGRPMVFSEADMYAKNYRFSDLTDVERRIQDTLDTTYTDLMYLTNYYDFDDEVLLTAAAMMATFNFNREFSNTKLLGESNTLYPQNFELKNFNYDAFMRLMLLNATGEPLMAEKDLYSRILEKTSLFTGILLILCDLLAVIAIPTMKVVVLLLLLFLSLAISISCVLTPPEKLAKTLVKNIGLPTLLFFIASVGFAYVISLFMGEGLTGYVGGRAPDLNISDPTVTMGLMVVVDCIYLFVLWKIVKLLLDSLKSHVVSSFFSSVALIAGAGASMVDGAMNKVKGAVGYGFRRRDYNRMLTATREAGGNGGSGGGFTGGGSSDLPSSRKTSGSLYNKDSGDLWRDSQYGDSNSRDDKFKSDIDALASTRADSSTPSTLGHKIIDLKHDVKNKVYDTVDSIKDTKQNIKHKIDYTTSKEGLRKDVVDSVKDVKVRATNYSNDLKNHNEQRQQDFDTKRQERERARANKDALLRNKQNQSNSSSTEQ